MTHNRVSFTVLLGFVSVVLLACTRAPQQKEEPPKPRFTDTFIDGSQYPLQYRQFKDSTTQLIKREGHFAASNPIGTHKYYDRLGNVRIEKEFVHWDARWIGYMRGIDLDVAQLMEEKFSYLNQIKYFDEKGNLRSDGSTFYTVQTVLMGPKDSIWFAVDFQQHGYEVAYSKLHLILPDESNKIRVIHRQGSSIDFKHHDDKLDGLAMVWMRKTDQESTDSAYDVRVFRVVTFK
jgi:hypothetical protein